MGTLMFYKSSTVPVHGWEQYSLVERTSSYRGWSVWLLLTRKCALEDAHSGFCCKAVK
jgi:hypothetical protein